MMLKNHYLHKMQKIDNQIEYCNYCISDLTHYERNCTLKEEHFRKKIRKYLYKDMLLKDKVNRTKG